MKYTVFKFTPLQWQLYIFVKFLDTKVSERTHFETPEGVPSKGLFTWM